MVRREVHCRTITQMPEKAQTAAGDKYAALVQIMDIIVLAQRQATWKVFFPPSGSTDDDTTTTD